MSVRVFVHLTNEEPFYGDMEELPSSSATHIRLSNLKDRNNKKVTWVAPGTSSYIFPWSRIAYMEVCVTENASDVFGFYRQDEKS